MNEQSAPDVFLSALSMRDFGRVAECLAPTAQARFLLPRGAEVCSGGEQIARRFEGWFGRGSDFEVLGAHREQVGHRNRLNWRFRLSRDGESHEVIEQVAFVNVGPDGISEMDLLCSGFLRDDSTGTGSATVDRCAVPLLERAGDPVRSVRHNGQ
jgi:hypothetical protein